VRRGLEGVRRGEEELLGVRRGEEERGEEEG